MSRERHVTTPATTPPSHALPPPDTLLPPVQDGARLGRDYLGACMKHVDITAPEKQGDLEGAAAGWKHAAKKETAGRPRAAQCLRPKRPRQA